MNNTNKKGMYCPLTGAYIPRLLLCAIVGFVFIFAFDFVLHAQILAGTYKQAPQLWRTDADMQTYLGYGMLMQFLTAFLLAAIYSKGHEGKGIGEGLRYGLLIGLLLGICGAAALAYMPIPVELAQAWFAGGLAEGLGLGVIYSLLYTSPCCAKGACDAKGAERAP